MLTRGVAGPGVGVGTVRCQCVWRTRPLHTGIGWGGEAGEVAQGRDMEGLEHLSKVTGKVDWRVRGKSITIIRWVRGLHQGLGRKGPLWRCKAEMNEQF